MAIRFQTLFLLFFTFTAFSQTTNSTFSPYSLFGLGKFNEANTGVTNALGKSGIAIASEYEINGLNPASLAKINRNSFFFDLGMKAEYNTYGDKNDTDAKPTLYNFSNISIAFPVGKKGGASLSLIPFTEVGYFFQGIVTNIEGTQTNSISNIIGSGGLNNINLNYARTINEKLNIGVSAKYYFGSIKQNEMVTLESGLLSIEDVNQYKGFKFETGLQYQATTALNLAVVMSFPSILKGSRDRNVTKIADQIPSILESTVGLKIKNYETPFDFTIGLKYDFKNYSLVSDYKKTFWGSTNMVDNIGKYTNSSVYGIGIEYFKKKTVHFGEKSKYRYRLGFNYDDGNLKVKNKKIANTSFTSGIGIPLGNSYNSFLNISYTYGNKGIISNTLIKENYHTLTLNFSFEDLWFKRRLLD
jgi:hypothetical protein